MDYIENRKYFSSKGIYIFLVILGILTFPIYFIGVIPLSIGIVKLLKLKGSPSDSFIDKQVDAEYEELVEKAFSKFEITKENEDKLIEIEPLILGGYMLDVAYAEESAQDKITSKGLNILTNGSSLVDKAFALWDTKKDHKKTKSGMKLKEGKDKINRTSTVGWSILFFSEDEVFLYQEIFNLLSPEREEFYKKYAYKDILSVSTEMETAYSRFIMEMSNGDKKVISWYAGNNNKSYSSEDSTIDKTVSTLKEYIREKKRS